jgi:hypothetical protein
VLGLYRDRYFDLNVQHLCEKSREEHSVRLSDTLVKLALQRGGRVKKGHAPLRRPTLNALEHDKMGLPTGATRFRRKLSRLEGMPGLTCPQSGEKV